MSSEEEPWSPQLPSRLTSLQLQYCGFWVDGYSSDVLGLEGIVTSGACGLQSLSLEVNSAMDDVEQLTGLQGLTSLRLATSALEAIEDWVDDVADIVSQLPNLRSAEVTRWNLAQWMWQGPQPLQLPQLTSLKVADVRVDEDSLGLDPPEGWLADLLPDLQCFDVSAMGGDSGDLFIHALRGHPCVASLSLDVFDEPQWGQPLLQTLPALTSISCSDAGAVNVAAILADAAACAGLRELALETYCRGSILLGALQQLPAGVCTGLTKLALSSPRDGLSLTHLAALFGGGLQGLQRLEVMGHDDCGVISGSRERVQLLEAVQDPAAAAGGQLLSLACAFVGATPLVQSPGVWGGGLHFFGAKVGTFFV